MTKKDYNYIQNVLGSFKQCIISNILNTGSLSQRFQVRFEDIKNSTDRVRLSPAIIDEYINFLEQQGISAISDNVYSILCEVDLTQTYLTPIEAEDVSSYMNGYNTKVALEYQ